MKRINGLFAASLATMLLAAALPLALAGCTDTTTAAVEEQNLTTLNFSVTGMHCQGCVASVRNAIAKIDGVQSCEVSLEGESATVKARDEEASQRIIDAVAALDFTIARSD